MNRHSRGRRRGAPSWTSWALAGWVFGLAWGTTGCHPPEPPKGEEPLPAADVSVRAARSGAHQSMEFVVGTVRARWRAAIEAKMAGRIARLPVVPGQRIEKGALIAELDAAEIAAQVERARAVLQQAEREWTRFQTLLRDEAVTQAESDAVEARFRIAKAALAEAETMLGYAQVTAPFSGVVARKTADVGDMAGPGRPIVEVEDTETLRFEADVPETLLGRVNVGDRLRIEVSSLPAPIEAVVGEIEPSADAASRTFRIRLDLPRDTGARAGLFGRVGIPVGESAILAVPADAVVVRGQMEMVFVVRESRAELRLVRTGTRLGGEIEILSGLEEGETVVTRGTGSLRDGQPVRVN